jgi:hypothetical protein
MMITRTLPPDTGDATIQAVVDHVRAELSAMADADDDPDTNASDVQIRVHALDAGALDGTTGQVYEDACVLVIGELDMEPDAPYLKPGYDPYADVVGELEVLVRRNPVAAAALDSAAAENRGKHVRRQ